jgi:aspartyl-tRNA(Asn)/glutamyl-tRNA(Gln) amidotransferase subunit A
LNAVDDLSVDAILPLLRRREISPVELVEGVFRRIDDWEPKLNAFISLFRQEALEEARSAERRLAHDDARPLEGIPIALKDNIAARGAPTTAGSAILRESETSVDAEVVGRLRAAGAIVIGKTNLHEFCLGGSTDNPHFGATRNPWDLSRIPGGSSGGSAAALAAGECLAAIGTDTGGSIRVPAALTGATGLRPTIGAVSNERVVPLAWSLDTVGPICRTAVDCARLMSALVCRKSQLSPLRADDRSSTSTLRIGIVRGYGTAPRPDVAEAAERAVAELAAHVRLVEGARVPYFDETRIAQAVIELCEAAAYHEQWFPERGAEYGADVRELLKLGRMFHAGDYIQAQRFRTMLGTALAKEFERVDVLVCPMVPFPAPRASTGATMLELGNDSDEIWSMFCYAEFASLAGLPALSMPCGLSREGLPIGMQLVGRPFAESTLLDLAITYQEVTSWHEALPRQALASGGE